MAALVKLPGVGRKTANVVLGNAFTKNEGVVVDTHVARVSHRLGLTQGERSGEDRAGSDAAISARRLGAAVAPAHFSRPKNLRGEASQVRNLPAERHLPVKHGLGIIRTEVSTYLKNCNPL